MPNLTLPDDVYNEVLRLIRLYTREAHKCRENKTYLAGCIMAGAALEATLLAVANCLPEDASASPVAPRKKGNIKPLVEWKFHELLAVARAREWLPAGLSPEEEWDSVRARIGDYAEALRQIRNFVHPIRYALDFPRKRITIKHIRSSFQIAEAANDHLMNRILQALNSLADESYDQRDTAHASQVWQELCGSARVEIEIGG